MNDALKRQLTSCYDEAVRDVPVALSTEGFGVLTEIDVADTMRKKIGIDFRRYRIFGACNPALAHEALSATLDAGTMLPCSVVLYEDDGGRSVVLAADPMRAAGQDPRLMRVAEVVRDKLRRVLERLK